jgi:hypothetical protein
LFYKYSEFFIDRFLFAECGRIFTSEVSDYVMPPLVVFVFKMAYHLKPVDLINFLGMAALVVGLFITFPLNLGALAYACDDVIAANGNC